MTASKSFILITAALATVVALATERVSPPAEDLVPASHGLVIDARLLVGGTPNDDLMRRLHHRGVRTLVSVDGMRPEVELAKQHGLRYFHIPIGYDGVPRIAALALTRVARESNGGIYVHCHHGKHRGPAAAAIVGRVLGVLEDDDDVQRLLTTAGTDRRFASLWRDAIAFRPPSPAAKLPKLRPVAEVNPLAAAMAAAERAWNQIQFGSEMRASALLLREAMRESIRAANEQENPPPDEQMLVWLKQAEATVGSLEQAIDKTSMHATRQAIGNQCVRCHERYRD